MRSEQLKGVLRLAATAVLFLLAGIQLMGKVIDMVKASQPGAFALAVFVLIYILPLLVGLALYKSLNRAFQEGQMTAKSRYICVDWLILLLLLNYVSIGHFWK